MEMILILIVFVMIYQSDALKGKLLMQPPTLLLTVAIALLLMVLANIFIIGQKKKIYIKIYLIGF